MQKIKDFPNYAVSQQGKVWNIKRNKEKAQQTYHGYKYVQLHRNGETKVVSVHRLVAEAFLPNPQKLPCVNHKDENKENNCVENLEWCTYKYNNEYGVGQPTKRAAAARKKPVLQYSLKGELLARYKSATDAQRKTGIGQQNISRCCLCRKSFQTAGGFVWAFETEK